MFKRAPSLRDAPLPLPLEDEDKLKELSPPAYLDLFTGCLKQSLNDARWLVILPPDFP
jgi:hypothetical protein